MRLAKTNILFTSILLLVLHSPPHGKAFTRANLKDINSLAPIDLHGWKQVGEIEAARGENLFSLINGGAEIYHEYGFRQTIHLTYKNYDNKSINVEIYEMENAASAYGIYSFKTGKSGKKHSIGNDATLEDYYLNFWKGNFLVTLIGFDSKPDTKQGLIQIARFIEKKITVQGKRPELINLLAEYEQPLQKIKYLRGNLALFNNYIFDSQNIFGLKEGIIADYGRFKIFLFKYASSKECKKWFLNALFALKSNKKFVNLELNRTSFLVKDKKKHFILAVMFKNYIPMVLSTDESEAKNMMKVTQQKISDILHKEANGKN